MNWHDIAAGSWPDNEAFARLPRSEQSDQIREAIQLALKAQRQAPGESYRIAAAAVHLMDSQRMDEVVKRVQLCALLGGAAMNLGQPEEAQSHLRHAIDGPMDAETGPTRVQALVALVGLLAEDSPDEALRLCSRARAEGRRLGDAFVVANVSITLGALQRRRGEYEVARRTFEMAIESIEHNVEQAGPNTAQVLASLHGNLANLLTDDLASHDAAIVHFSESIRHWELAGNEAGANARWFHRLSAMIDAGRHEDALSLLAASSRRAKTGSKALRDFVLELRWAKAPQHLLKRWDETFARLDHEGDADASTQVMLIAARIVLKVLQSDWSGAHALADEPRLMLLPDSRLRAIIGEVVTRLALQTGRSGLLWHVRWRFPAGEDEVLLKMSALHVQEHAALQLASRVRRGHGLSSDADRSSLLVPGIASVPGEPPAWLGLDDPDSRRRYSGLRAACCPGGEAVRAELSTMPEATAESPIVDGSHVDSLKRAIFLADLLGEVELRVVARIRLCEALGARAGGFAGTALEKCIDLLDQAGGIADGIPRQQIRVHVTRANILKEATTDDVHQHLTGALRELESAWSLAQELGRAEVIVRVAINLSNVLVEPIFIDKAKLARAHSYLEHALTAIAGTSDVHTSGVLHNSLGIVHWRSFDVFREPPALEAACDQFRIALEYRETVGDAERILTVVSNLMGALMASREIGLPVNAAEIVALSRRVRSLVLEVPNAEKRCGALLNATAVLRHFDRENAVALGQEALAVAKQFALTRRLVDCHQRLGHLLRDRGSHAAAVREFEQAVLALEASRAEVRDSAYRAGLAKAYRALFDDLLESLRDAGATPESIWWAVERGAARTLVENLGQRHGYSNDSQQVVASTLTELLPPDCLLLQPYIVGVRIHCISLRKVDGRLSVRDHAALKTLVDFPGSRDDGKRLTTPRLSPALGELFDEQLDWLHANLLAPLLEDAAIAPCRRIVIAAQGFLGNIAWHAVPVRPGHTRLGELYEVAQVPCATVLASLMSTRGRQVRKAVFVACDPTQTLVRHIDETLQAFKLLGCAEKIVITDASRAVHAETVLAACADADLLHFSGHGVLKTGDMNGSGLLLSDGLLSVTQIEQTLSSRVPATVVLSCCDSASDDSEFSEVPTLTTAFLQAGARAVVGTAWPVPDSIAADTTRTFYALVSEEGPIAALTLARREVQAQTSSRFAQSFKVVGWD